MGLHVRPGTLNGVVQFDRAFGHNGTLYAETWPRGLSRGRATRWASVRVGWLSVRHKSTNPAVPQNDKTHARTAARLLAHSTLSYAPSRAGWWLGPQT
jgi:hypothetical protein